MALRDKIYRTVVLALLWIMYLKLRLEFIPAMPRAAFWVGLIISNIGLGAIWLTNPFPIKDDEALGGE